MFESIHMWHGKVLEGETSRALGIQKEREVLSLHSRKTNDISAFEAYLKAKKEHDDRTEWFYRQVNGEDESSGFSGKAS